MKRLFSLSLVLCLFADALAADVCAYEAKADVINSYGCPNKTSDSNGEFEVSANSTCVFLVNGGGPYTFCSDLTKYDRVEFDILVPYGSKSYMSMVSHHTKDKDCGGSDFGSLYSDYPLSLKDLIVDQTTYQHVVIPLATFDNAEDIPLNFNLIDGKECLNAAYNALKINV
ncbi:hypothetical protein HK098_002949 [Nowakowskiella sp. JEL0407]|nr:hypothetical protein HK098_002949 [Nowakowskiella sp. JEL0407]